MRPPTSHGRLTAVVILAAVVMTAAAASAYVLNGPKWATTQVPYYINPANLDMPEADAISAIQTGAMAWTQQSNAAIVPYYMGRTSGTSITRNGKSEVFFRNTSGGLYGETYWWYDASYRLIEADILFYDGGTKFFSGSSGCSGGVYLTDATTHEFGHVLGLGHSSLSTASMYPTMSWCSMNPRTLDSDDLAGIEKLYPAGGTNTAPSVSITAPGSITVAAGTSVTFAGSATDKEDGNISSRLIWTSNLDGQIGTGGSFVRSLSAGVHVVTASASDSAGVNASKQITVTFLLSEAAPIAGVALSAVAYKTTVSQRVDMSWSGAKTTYVKIYRNGVMILKTPNDGTQSDLTVLLGGTYKYKVCETGSTGVCSNRVTVSF